MDFNVLIRDFIAEINFFLYDLTVAITNFLQNLGLGG